MSAARSVHIDAPAGAAGDMLLGALVDAGVAVEDLAAVLEGLDLPGWELRAEPVVRAGQAATKAVVTVTSDPAPRRYSDIRHLLHAARLPSAVRDRALATFRRLAEAEGRVHATAADQVTLHETGAVDAIVDIVGVAAGMELLGAQRVTCAGVAQGTGTVETAHGTVPLPAPAVVELLRGAPTYARPVATELCTPTGAALLAEWVDAWTGQPPMTVRTAGYGAGSRELDFPNVIRMVVGDPLAEATASPADGATTPAVMVEATVDDLPGELVPTVLEALLDAGADDAWAQPVLMKKGRPGLTITCLSPPERAEAARRVLVTETTTLGVRSHHVDKWVLARDSVTVEVAGHPVRIKVGRLAGQVVNAAPEYADCAEAARASGLAVKDVYARARSAWETEGQ